MPIFGPLKPVFVWLLDPYRRPWTVWIFFTVFLMGMFWLFAYGWGWPPIVDKCVAEDMSCYCEQFKISATELMGYDARNEWWNGVMQPVNTYSNLYAIVTAGYVACRLWRDRKANPSGVNGNVLSSKWWMGDVWVFCVLFLGLGSMWFHGSISAGVSWFDGFSMFVFTGFMIFYSLDRGFARYQVNPTVRTWVFWLGYPFITILFTIIAARGLNSEILIGVQIGIYAVIEFALSRFVFWPDWSKWVWKPFFLWVGGLSAFLVAVLLRAQAVKPDDPWCSPESFWQPHAFWHLFAGVMAICLYFYWREDKGGVGKLPDGYQ